MSIKIFYFYIDIFQLVIETFGTLTTRQVNYFYLNFFRLRCNLGYKISIVILVVNEKVNLKGYVVKWVLQLNWTKINAMAVKNV